MIPVAVFVKTPGLSPIKTRLASGIGKEKAEAFYRLSCEWTAQALKRVQAEFPVTGFWAVAEERGMESDFWRSFPTLFQGQGDLGDRLHHIYQALHSRFGSAIVLGADSPELSSQSIKTAVEELQNPKGHCFVLGKTEDGGFYLLGGKKPIAKEIWTSVRYSEESTGEAIRTRVADLGTIKTLPSCADVDWVEDLKKVMDRLRQSDPEKYSSLLALKLI